MLKYKITSHLKHPGIRDLHLIWKTHRHFQVKSEIRWENNLLFLLPAKVIFLVVKKYYFSSVLQNS